MRQRKRWSELSPAARTAIVVGGFAEAIVTAIALQIWSGNHERGPRQQVPLGDRVLRTADRLAALPRCRPTLNRALI